VLQYLSSHNNISYEILIKCPCCAAVPHRSRGRLSDIELHHPASVGAAARTPLAYDIWTRTNTNVKGIAKACQTRLVYIRPYLHSELHTSDIVLDPRTIAGFQPCLGTAVQQRSYWSCRSAHMLNTRRSGLHPQYVAQVGDLNSTTQMPISRPRGLLLAYCRSFMSSFTRHR